VSKAQLKAVFSHIGGEEKLREILRDFYNRMSQDVLIGFFFSGKDIQAIADQQANFLLFASGMKPTYQGKSPTNAHLALPPILKGHFDRRLVILRETLEAHSLNKKDIKTWINFENAFRNVVQA
jgi:truncated hemoglobin YjbI